MTVDQTLEPSSLIDLDRYPVIDLGSAAADEVIAGYRASLASRGVAILPGFVRPETIEVMAREVESLVERAFHEDVWGTPYLGLPDDSFPEGHPQRATHRSATSVIAYDLIPQGCTVRALYEWDPLMTFLGEILDRRPLYRFADPLGALNLTSMGEGDVQGWHYDSTDFVVSLAIQSSEAGGDFECAAMVRDGEDEHYDEVAAILAGDAPDRIEVLAMTPGTLMIFEGRNSLHRVSPVGAGRPRFVGLFAYDTAPGTNSSELLKLVRYGRTESIVGATAPGGAG